MTDKNPVPLETLKEILRQARNPESLDDHPWTRSLFVQEALADDPRLAGAGPGQQLVGAIAGLFPQLKPPNPPRRGLRLDPRWGEFGLLAAYYFIPYTNGTAFPSSLLEAWGRIDPAILYFVYGKPADALEAEDVEKYRLVGAELEYASPSTLSDWHKKGVGRLAETILNRERYLARALAKPSGILHPGQDGGVESSETGLRKWVAGRTRALWLTLALVIVLALGLGTLKTWRVYQQGRLVYADVNRLRALRRGPIALDTLERAGPALEALQDDLAVLRQEAGPLLWLAPRLGWVPVYGSDLAAAPQLVALAEHSVDASVLTLQAARPFVEEFNAPGSSLDPARLTGLLLEAQPGLLDARAELDRALAVRKEVQAEGLSPDLQDLMIAELDPLLALADEGLTAALALPTAMGATDQGPKTYLILVQNEDELRPTGGFITSVGKLVIQDGQVISLTFENSGDQEDWSKPYPMAPWQLQEYMNSRVMVLRDANWFTDFPTTALWVEHLYAYIHSHSVDGVIAFDQRLLLMLLEVLEPLEVDGAAQPITSDNVVAYMRQAKQRPQAELVQPDWDNKEFIGLIADAVLEKVLAGQGVDWKALATVFFKAMDERHLLLLMDDPQIEDLLARRGWDNTLNPEPGDFLMAVDTNIGYNKTNAVVESSLTYDVNLTDLLRPESSLVIVHTNHADEEIPCIHWNTGEITGEEAYPIDRCYWNYLRIYRPQGTQLLDATPHAIPGEWMILEKAVPARVDELEEEGQGVQGFGTLLVVPGGESVQTSFQFALPQQVVSVEPGSGLITYHLKVHKQPGTLAVPLTLRVHLPEKVTLHSSSLEMSQQGSNLLLNTNLRQDVDLLLEFSMP